MPVKRKSQVELLLGFLAECQKPGVRIEYMRDTLRGWQVTTWEQMPVRFGHYRYKVFAPVARKFYKTEIGRHDVYVHKDTKVQFEAESVSDSLVYLKSTHGLVRCHVTFKELLEKFTMEDGNPAGVCEMRCISQF